MGQHIVSAFSYPVEKAEIVKKFKKLAEREEKTISKLIIELMENYIKVHGNGNPIHELTQWVDPDFKSFPAFKERLTTNWIPFMEKCNEKELQEIAEQSEGILNKALEIKRRK